MKLPRQSLRRGGVTLSPAVLQPMGQPPWVLSGQHRILHQAEVVKPQRIGVDIVGKYLRNGLQPGQGAGGDGIIQPGHGLACRQQAHGAAGGCVYIIDQSLPAWQILLEPLPPRGCSAFVKGHLGASAAVETVPGLLQVELHIRVGAAGQLIELGHGFFGVAPFQVIGQRDCLGDDHRIHRRGQPLAGIDAFGVFGVLPIVAERRAIDDLGLDRDRCGCTRLFRQ